MNRSGNLRKKQIIEHGYFNFLNDAFGSINNVAKLYTHMDTKITKLENNNVEIFILLIVVILFIYKYNN